MSSRQHTPLMTFILTMVIELAPEKKQDYIQH